MADQEALALTDVHSLAGAVQFALACKKYLIKPIFGAEVWVDGFPLVLLCLNQTGYANLCDVLTLAHAFAHEERLTPELCLEQLESYTDGLVCLTGDRWGHVATSVREGHNERALRFLRVLRVMFPQRLFVELTHHQRPSDVLAIRVLIGLAQREKVPIVATNAVRHATSYEYALHDALTCARLGISVGEPHPERPVNNQAYLKLEREMRELGFPTEALSNTALVASWCDVDVLRPQVTPPRAQLPPNVAAGEFLRQECCRELGCKYGQDASIALATLQRELHTIETLGLQEFFLVVREVVQFARSKGIRCSGRGSAANSLVAYLLGITGVDPIKHHLLFERFLHTGRKGMPDIDIDFETHRRTEVINWMSRRFGHSHTAMTANVVTFRLRLAVREIGKVLGFPLPLIDRLCKVLPHASAHRIREHRDDLIPILGDSPALEVLCKLVESLHGCPRHLSLHNGGMILSREPLRHISPVQTSANGVRQLQFNKDDIEALGLIKFDVLGLRTLSVVSETLELIGSQGQESPDVDALPLDDKEAFELIREGRTLSVFQIESPGQWNLLSRSQPTVFDDLIAQVALFRPGPLQGNMVHPYILRRQGLKPVSYPHPSLEPVLRDTYGVILYQEQVLEVAHHFAGLSLAQADEFRRLMSKFRNAEEMEGMRSRFVQGAIQKHSVPPALANCVFDIIAKFVGYGFCRSHAAAFAHTVYHTAYLKAHFPAAYMAAVLEHKPGFYPLQTVLEEARLCGIDVLPADIRYSAVKYSLEEGKIRVPLTQIKDVSTRIAQQIVHEREVSPFEGIEDLYQRVAMERDVWQNLARSGALECFGTRRKVLWTLGILTRRLGASGQQQLALKTKAFLTSELPSLKKLAMTEVTAWNFETQSLTTGPHPMALRRNYLQRVGITPVRELLLGKPGSRVMTAGVVISRQRPPTAKGMCFIILEDETGRIPTAITPPVYEKYRQELRKSALMVEGKLEGSGTGQIGMYRSILIQRLWSLAEVNGGYSGHPGEMAR
jgi:error-prone DNA polymerase